MSSQESGVVKTSTETPGHNDRFTEETPKGPYPPSLGDQEPCRDFHHNIMTLLPSNHSFR